MEFTASRGSVKLRHIGFRQMRAFPDPLAGKSIIPATKSVMVEGSLYGLASTGLAPVERRVTG